MKRNKILPFAKRNEISLFFLEKQAKFEGKKEFLVWLYFVFS
jgi:hypothetical protein